MHPTELLGDVGHVESRFGPFGDSISVGEEKFTVCAKRTICLGNCFGHNDGTPTCRGSSGCSFWSIWR